MSMLSAGLKSAERRISAAIPHQHSAEKRQQMYATRDQMQFYQEQRDTLSKQASDLATQRHTEHQKIHEKQIRAMRNNFSRSRSALMSSPSADSPSDKLG